jgi:23S rRNA maturation-related 3'-5' exoribonuclease YhaM
MDFFKPSTTPTFNHYGIMKTVKKERSSRATRDAVIHCIHAHHGPVKEWGSPEAPRTIEALILHQADMLSAGYGATTEKS